MMLQIADIASDFEVARTLNDSAPNDLLQVLVNTTACSSTVFYGLLAWASRDAHLPSKAEITTIVGRQGPRAHS
jgi:hypothetical protein